MCKYYKYEGNRDADIRPPSERRRFPGKSKSDRRRAAERALRTEY